MNDVHSSQPTSSDNAPNTDSEGYPIAPPGIRVVTAAMIESNELLRSVMDVALQRIRTSNSQFSNAVLTRAHIRIVGSGGATLSHS